SLLINMRANFNTRFDLVFASSFQLWSWTDNSGSRPDDPQNGMNDFAFLFDFIKIRDISDRIDLYAGGGAGIHFMAYWTKFPSSPPYYDIETGYQLRQITYQKSLLTPDILGGLQYHLWNGMYISTEIRYEFSNKFEQWKYFIGISLLD
ncbi:hypothetical protein ACFL67_04260, partial [candidate division KSB1 bacterium]